MSEPEVSPPCDCQLCRTGVGDGYGHDDGPKPPEPTLEVLELDLRTAESRLQKLATYANHYGNCRWSSWNKQLTKCDCGLFQLLVLIGYRNE